tara:strand:- start:2727 stop:3068 length:342 start_codon:yes stop_codon:yes gene_type:complete
MNTIKEKNKLEVFYNASCPICKREIDNYKARSKNITFKDSSLMEEKYNRRMHAFEDGNEFIGAEAFIKVWSRTDGFKWLSILFDNKISIFIMNIIYNPIAYILYNLHLRRIKK